MTYDGEPLYLFYKDAYIAGITGTSGLYGAGTVTPWGIFESVLPSPQEESINPPAPPGA